MAHTSAVKHGVKDSLIAYLLYREPFKIQDFWKELLDSCL